MVRSDVLITEARRAVDRASGQVGIPAPELVDLVVRLTDTLEAATGGMHIDAKHWAELARARVELKQLRRLHEVATERSAALAAVIERARRAPSAEVIDGGRRHDGVYTVLGFEPDEVLREHDAQVKAEAAAQALEEAADAAEVTDCPCSYAAAPGRFCIQHSHKSAHAHANQLRARAATYRKEQTDAD
jgi:hypothetical protein